MDIQSRIETKTTGTVNYMPPEVLSDGIVSKVGFLKRAHNVSVGALVNELRSTA